MPVTLPRTTTDLTALALGRFTFDASCPCHVQSAMDLQRQLFFFFPLYVPLVCKVQRKRNAYTLQEFLMSSLYFQLISSVLADP